METLTLPLTLNLQKQDAKLDQLVEKLAIVDGVKEAHEISTVYTDGKFYITLHACVNPELSVEEAHKIAETIERRMHLEIKPLENVTVHVEPSTYASSAASFDETQFKTL